MERLILEETTTREGVSLSNEECDLLLQIAPSIAIRPTRGKPGQYDLTPGSRIGAVRLGQRAIEIRPKMPIDRVFFMLSFAMGRVMENVPREAVQLGTDTTLIEAMVPAFVAHVRSAVRRGLLQGYQVEESAECFVRGRVRFSEQLRRRHGALLPVEIQYDDFTIDIEENRLLLAALARLRRVHLRHQASELVLREFESLFANVSLQTYSARSVPEFLYTRLNEHYKPALSLATLILQNSTLELRSGELSGVAVLFDMNGVVEDFIVAALREELGLSKRAFPKNCDGYPLFLDQAQSVRLKPDISVWRGGKCQLVGDVKYKNAGELTAHSGDLYQMLAYCEATSLSRGLLVYAGRSGPTERLSLGVTGREILVVRVDLDGTIEELQKSIGGLAEDIRSQITLA